MSAQTGRSTLGAPPPSSRRIERARLELARWRQDPNPVWVRELRQSARLVSTPVVLAIVTVMMTLLMASIGGVASVTAEPAKVGISLFHTFFSLAFFVVTWVAPAVAAATVASERGNRTWEALLLTGLGAKTIARGKFLAALTYVSLYIVMLAPVGALPFLFGGVTPTEVVTAFVVLFFFAALSVAFGLSVSSALGNPAVAIVVTLMVAVPLSLVSYVGLGPLLSIGAHELWPAVPAGPPVWLPTALARADFGLEYLTLLVIAPATLVVLPAWFFYEITVANMASPSDDRSSGLRRWMLVAIPASAVASGIPTFAATRDEWAAVGWAMTFLAVVIGFSVFVLAGEPLGPSRRVLTHWQRQGTGRVGRFFGPGVTRAAALVLALGGISLLGHVLLGVLLETAHGGSDVGRDVARLVSIAGYLGGFLTSLIGSSVWIRARSTSGVVPRLVLVGLLFLSTVGPWIAMAIGGVLSEGDDAALVLAAPSPTYILVMTEWIGRTDGPRDVILLAGAACAAAWALLGIGMLGLGGLRARRIIAAHRAALLQVEATLAAEDRAASEAA